jgi:hypothetical protein
MKSVVSDKICLAETDSWLYALDAAFSNAHLLIPPALFQLHSQIVENAWLIAPGVSPSSRHYAP